MNRGDLARYLAAAFHALALEAGQPEGDTPDGYGLAIDQAFRALGVTPQNAGTIEILDGVSIDDLIALGEYHALRGLLRPLALYADVRMDAPAVDKKRSQVFKQANLLLDDARRVIAQRGYGPDAITRGGVSLNFIAATDGVW